MYICKYRKWPLFYIPSSVTHVTLFSLALFYLYYLILPPKKGPPWCTKRWGCPISSLSLKCVQDDCAHFLSRFEYFQVWKNLARVIWVKWNIFSFVPPASKKIAGGPPKYGGGLNGGIYWCITASIETWWSTSLPSCWKIISVSLFSHQRGIRVDDQLGRRFFGFKPL